MRLRGLRSRIRRYIYCHKHIVHVISASNQRAEKRIFYFGIPMHPNIGDLAQCVCIRNFFKKIYPDYLVVEIDSTVFMDSTKILRSKLKKIICKSDLIFFQSGYCTQDLGGVEDLMHQAVIQDYPQNKLVMLPQTIFFNSEEREKQASRIYNAHKYLLFLSRDAVSHRKAEKIFPDVMKLLFPDIVTTMIGTMKINCSRKGILMCMRNDSEKYYSDYEIDKLKTQLNVLTDVDILDTTVMKRINALSPDLNEYVETFIKNFGHYKLVITDRYHGTIFSLVAGTPVIVIKTTDHKVKTGVEWFKGIYDSIVYIDEIADVSGYAKTMLQKEWEYYNAPCFEETYYVKLKLEIDKI